MLFHRKGRGGKRHFAEPSQSSLRDASCSPFWLRYFPPARGKSVPKGGAIGSPYEVLFSSETYPLADASHLEEAFRYGNLSRSDSKSAEAENTVKRSSRRIGVNLQYFRLEPASLGSERGEQPLSCNDDDRCLRQKQGGVVGAVASRMRDPPKGRSRRWVPQPVQGRGVSRG